MSFRLPRETSSKRKYLRKQSFFLRPRQDKINCDPSVPPIQLANITLSREDAYIPGEVVEGTVSFVVARSVDIRCLRVKCVGRERVILGTKSTEKSSGTIVLFKQLVTLLGATPLDERSSKFPCVTLPSGEYSFPFRFQLGFLLPASCCVSSADGVQLSRIRYDIKVYADTTAKGSRDFSLRRQFPVMVTMTALQARYLQNDARWGVSEVCEQQVPENCLCLPCGMAEGSVELQVSSDKHVAILQHSTTLKLAIHINNTTARPVSAIFVSLRNRIVARTDPLLMSDRMVETTAVSNRVAVGVPPHQSKNVTVDLEVRPSLTMETPPSMVSHLIRSKWFVFVEVEDKVPTSPWCMMPIVVAEAIDDTNQCDPIDFIDPVYPRLRKGEQTLL